jgi:cytochrome c oxidase subunit 2
MGPSFPLFTEPASTVAKQVDLLFFFLIAVSLFFSVLIFCTVFYFAVRYRRRWQGEVPPLIPGSMTLVLTWTIIPFIITMVMFGWASTLFIRNARPPVGAMEIYVVGKQWMWKVQHPEGQREINELHVPVGRPIKLVMATEDVIHSFYIPAFRIKQDVVPGRYTSEWFQADKTGRFHLFCAEYCGTRHSGMVGWVHVMEPADYENWLGGGSTAGSMSASGEKLFLRLGCSTCHLPKGGGRGPSLVGVFGQQVTLDNKQTVLADESYIRESILNPKAKVVAGYEPVMPTFQGQISEEGLLQLIAYVKSLGKAPATEVEPGAPAKGSK